MQDPTDSVRRNEFERLRRDTIKAGAGFVLAFLAIYFLAFQWIWPDAENMLRFIAAMVLFMIGIFYFQISYFESIYRKAFDEPVEQAVRPKWFSSEWWSSQSDMSPGTGFIFLLGLLELPGIGITAFLVFLISCLLSWKHQAGMLSLLAGNLFYFLFTIAVPKTIYRRGERDRKRISKEEASRQKSNFLIQYYGFDNKWSRQSKGIKFWFISFLVSHAIGTPLGYYVSIYFYYVGFLLWVGSMIVLHYIAYKEGFLDVLAEHKIKLKHKYRLYRKPFLIYLKILAPCLFAGIVIYVINIYFPDFKKIQFIPFVLAGSVILHYLPYQYERGMKDARARFVKEPQKPSTEAGVGLA